MYVLLKSCPCLYSNNPIFFGQNLFRVTNSELFCRSGLAVWKEQTDLGNGSVVPILQCKAWEHEGLSVGVDGSREGDKGPLGVQNSPGIRKTLGNVTEDSSFKCHS
jgi:hypothetical protein